MDVKKKKFDLSHGRYVYQVVVPKALAPKELVQVYEAGELVVLPAWDPMVRIHVILFFIYFPLNVKFKGSIGLISFFFKYFGMS